MLRNLHYDTSQNYNEKLKKYGFERCYNLAVDAIYYTEICTKKFSGLLSDKFLKNLTPHVIEVPEKNFHKYNYILKDLLYEPQKRYHEDALYKNGIEKYYN